MVNTDQQYQIDEIEDTDTCYDVALKLCGINPENRNLDEILRTEFKRMNKPEDSDLIILHVAGNPNNHCHAIHRTPDGRLIHRQNQGYPISPISFEELRGDCEKYGLEMRFYKKNVINYFVRICKL